MRSSFAHPAIVTLIALLLLAAICGPVAAAPEGTLTWGLHVTLASRWLDPSDTEAFINRQALNQAETLGLSRPTGGLIPRSLEFSLAYEPPAYDPAQAKKLLAEAGYPSGFDAGDLTPFPPFFSLAEAIGGYLQAVGIRTRLRTMERATFLTAWREHKIKGVIMGLGAPAGNAATRIEVYVTKNGIYSTGVVPEIEDLYQRQARELDRKKRESMLHQIQQIMHDRVLHVPIYELAFLWGIGPRVEEACIDHIKGFSYSAPYEDLRLKAAR